MVGKLKLSSSDKAEILKAVEIAEKQTSGEIVTVIAGQSGDYRAASLAFSVSLALISSLVLYYFSSLKFFNELWLIQLGIFLCSEFIMALTGYEALLVPNSVKQKAAARHARAIFFEKGLHITESRAGILFFVSLKEHYAEILTDVAITNNTKPEEWQHIIEEFINNVKQKQYKNGFIKAINSSGDILSRHFPATGNDKNEIPDRISEI